jgi:hypothetical protein
MRGAKAAAEPVDLAAREQERAEASQPADSSGDGELIRWSLSLAAEERLAVLQDFVDTFWTPRHG